MRLSRDNLSANASAIADYLGVRGSDVGMTTLPLGYCYGLSVLHSHLDRGAAVATAASLAVGCACWSLEQRVRSRLAVPRQGEP